jgi:HlyD family secretion protein
MTAANRKFPMRGIAILALVLVVGAVVTLKVVHKKKDTITIPTVPVERQDIVVTVEADGTIEPINVVDVRSKASGQITQMPVDIGSVVKQGQLLVQVDPRDVKNQYDQSLAALKAAQVQQAVTSADEKRSDDLHAEKVVTDQEHDATVLTAENARSSLVAARTNLDIAKQRLDDATVRAPISGTVIAKPVAVGQVISSATTSVSGGTSLLSMADLRQIRIRALVNETDIGNVRPGEEATVVVDAYPDRTFRGSVEKIEPQAVVEQSVTEFPVLITLPNEGGLLMPGMNGNVTILVEQQNDVLAVPVDAVRSIRELPQAATALGLDPNKARDEMRAQRPGGGGGGGGGGNGGGGGQTAGGGNASGMAYGAPGQGGGGPGSQAGTGGGRGGWGRRGAGADSARGGQGGWGGWSGGGRGRQGRDSTSARGGSFAGGGRGFGGGGRDTSHAGGAPRAQARVVFVKTANGFEPRMVRLGVSNYDYAQVLSGLKEGEQVALISAAQLQQQRQESLQRIQQRMGSGVPGMSQQGGGGGGAGRGGGGGGPRGGGG